MATYYRWRKSSIEYTRTVTYPGSAKITFPYWIATTISPDFNEVTGEFTLTQQWSNYGTMTNDGYAIGQTQYTDTIYTTPGGRLMISSDGTVSAYRGTLNQTKAHPGAGVFQDYVYSTSSSTYPNGGVSGSYYYDQRTTVTSPTAPTGLTYPNPITTPSAAISWTAATSATDYPVSMYEVSYSTNGGSSWTVAGTTAEVSYTFSITPGTTSIMFRVRAQDSNGQWGSYMTGTASQVLLAPTLTVPQMVMQGQSATISWSAIEGADSYTLQRKSSADADWTQVYNGANLSYSETVGTWTSLQYRVQAVFDGTAGGWATSYPIQIVSASALVISGQDGDLGTLVNDVPYSISSDQASPTIDVTVEVNGGEYAAFQATSGQTYTIGVLDLPTGTGSIVITATTTVSESPVTVTRTWTYSKTAQTFPNSGSVATLTKEGNVVYPETLTEAVRAAMTPWGGNLSTVLDTLTRAALYNRTRQAKYREVKVDLSNVSVNQIVNIPEYGSIVPHIVVQIGNPNPEIYDESCNGVWLLRRDIAENRQWNDTDYNDYANSTVNSYLNVEWMNRYPETVKSAILQVKIPYRAGAGVSRVVTDGPNGLSVKAFLLSGTELNYDPIPFPENEGAVLSYFEGTAPADSKRIANFNGSPSNWMLRSPYCITPTTHPNEYSSVTGIHGTFGASQCITQSGIRPCIIMQPTFSAEYYVDSFGVIHPSQEYTEAGDWLDVWGNTIPAVKIETGSYVGTGTYGQSNPNTLTFPFEPKVVFIGDATSSPSNLYYGTYIPLIQGVKTAISQIVTNGGKDILYVSWDGNTVSYYSNGGTDFVKSQLNATGVTYNYVAIG